MCNEIVFLDVKTKAKMIVRNVFVVEIVFLGVCLHCVSELSP